MNEREPMGPYAQGCLGGIVTLVIGFFVIKYADLALGLLIILAGPIIGYVRGFRRVNRWADAKIKNEARVRAQQFDLDQAKSVIHELFSIAKKYEEGRLLVGPETPKNAPPGLSQSELLEDEYYEFVCKVGLSDPSILEIVQEQIRKNKRVFVVHSDIMNESGLYCIYSRSLLFEQ
jgi:hypothetical protein